MSAQDKLALGMILFMLFFVIAFLIVPAQAYRDYLDGLRRRRRGGIIKALLAAVFALSCPYFYDELIGLDSRTGSVILQVTMGACVYSVLLDVVWFIYKNFGSPSRQRRKSK